MKITDIDFKEDGKKYFCKDTNEIFEIKEGDLIAATRSFSMAELLRMEFEKIKETKEIKNPYGRVDYKDWYYAIEREGYIASLADYSNYDNRMFNIANYFNNKEYAIYIAFKETLMRKMDRFAWDHNAKAIDWGNGVTKYYIIFSHIDNELIVRGASMYMSNDIIYFTSKKIAEKALEEFKDDLMKLYTWKFDFS